MLSLVWLIYVFKLGTLFTTGLMKKFLQQTFLGVIQSKDENETDQGNCFELKSEYENQVTRADTESGIELETELGPAKMVNGLDRLVCEELFGNLKKVGNLTTSFPGENLSHPVHETGDGDGWTVPAATTSVILNQDTTRHLPEERSKRVKVGSFFEEGAPWTRTEEQADLRGEGVRPVSVLKDYLPTKVTYDEIINICPNNKTKQDGSINRLGKHKTSLEEPKPQYIRQSESRRIEQLNDRKSVREDDPKSEWEFGSELDHPFTPLWEMWIGRNSRAAINHRFSKRPSYKELPLSELDNHKTLEKDKLMLGTRKGPKREVILIPDQELTRRVDRRGRSNGLHEEQLQFEEGLKKDAKMFKDFLVTDEPLLEDERLSLVGSSTSSDEDTGEQFEENLFNFYTRTPRSSCMDNFNKNKNDPHSPVIPIGIPLRRSSTTMKLDKHDREETNKFQMNNSSNPTNDKYGKKSNSSVMI